MSTKADAPAKVDTLPSETPPPPDPSRKTWTVGNITYGKLGLVALFFWLLWGDFWLTLSESALGPIMQIKLLRPEELNCDPALYAILLGTVPNIMNLVMNPIVSVSSDRHRGPRGRRIPYLIWSAPFISLFMILLGFGEDISSFVHSRFFSSMSPQAVGIWIFGTLTVLFGFANLFMQIVFSYLFNDVVPKEVMVRFMAYMRVVGTIAGMIYQWFIFGLSNKRGPLAIHIDLLNIHWTVFDYVWYPKIILIASGIVYIVGFALVLLRVKEPQYPPPPPLAKGQRFVEKFVSTLKTLATECFSHKFYWLFFIAMTFDFAASCTSHYQNPLWLSLGIDLGVVGKINAVSGLVTIGLTILTAKWGDKYRPLPLMVVAMIGMVVTAPVGLLYLIPGLSSETYLWIRIIYIVTHIPVGLVYAIAMSPLYMDLLPKARFGQFCAAAAMLRALTAGVLGTTLAGVFMKVMQHVHGGGDYYLRYVHAWSLVFLILELIFLVAVYREWKRLGGRDGFVPPEVGVPENAGAESPAK